MWWILPPKHVQCHKRFQSQKIFWIFASHQQYSRTFLGLPCVLGDCQWIGLEDVYFSVLHTDGWSTEDVFLGGLPGALSERFWVCRRLLQPKWNFISSTTTKMKFIFYVVRCAFYGSGRLVDTTISSKMCSRKDQLLWLSVSAHSKCLWMDITISIGCGMRIPPENINATTQPCLVTVTLYLWPWMDRPIHLRYSTKLSVCITIFFFAETIRVFSDDVPEENGVWRIETTAASFIIILLVLRVFMATWTPGKHFLERSVQIFQFSFQFVCTSQVRLFASPDVTGSILVEPIYRNKSICTPRRTVQACVKQWFFCIYLYT